MVADSNLALVTFEDCHAEGLRGYGGSAAELAAIFGVNTDVSVTLRLDFRLSSSANWNALHLR